MNRIAVTMAVALLFLQGCQNAGTVPPATPSQSHSDGIALVVNSFLSDHNGEGDAKFYSTYFVEDKDFDAEARSAVEKWRGRILIKIGDQDVNFVGGAVEDRTTRRPAKLISFHLNKNEADRMTIFVMWYSSTMASGTLEYEVVRESGKWKIVTKATRLIS